MSANPFNALAGATKPSPAALARALSPAAPSSSSTTPGLGDQSAKPAKKRKGHRGGKKKRSRRKSFAVLEEEGNDELEQASGEGFYKMPNLSGTSIDSEALLDHR